MRGIFIGMFLAQFVHLMWGVWNAWPRQKQWTTEGLKPPEKRGAPPHDKWEQEFEQDIIEFVSFRDHDSRRPQGTRFVYVSLSGIEVTSSMVVELIGEACGMRGLEAIAETKFNF